MNFDAKVRRESFEPVDLFYAHIGGMDAFAKGLKIAAAIRADGELDEDAQGPLQLLGHGRRRRDRGRQAQLRQRWRSTCCRKGDVTPNKSGRQELFENVVNQYVM